MDAKDLVVVNIGTVADRWVEPLARSHDRTFVVMSIAGQLHTPAPVVDSDPQKQHPHVLLYSSQIGGPALGMVTEPGTISLPSSVACLLAKFPAGRTQLNDSCS